MLFTCLPEGAQIPGRFPGPVHARGKWFTIDIHCHLLTQKAEEMVKDAGLSMDWQPRHHFANEQTREVNRQQSARTRVQGTTVEVRRCPGCDNPYLAFLVPGRHSLKELACPTVSCRRRFTRSATRHWEVPGQLAGRDTPAQ